MNIDITEFFASVLSLNKLTNEGAKLSKAPVNANGADMTEIVPKMLIIPPPIPPPISIVFFIFCFACSFLLPIALTINDLTESILLDADKAPPFVKSGDNLYKNPFLEILCHNIE